MPDDRPDLAAALADPSCDPIELGSGAFRASVTIERDVTLSGLGSGATTLLGVPDLEVLTVASPASVQLIGMDVLVHPDSLGSSALGKKAGASLGLSDVRVGTSGPLPQPPPLDDAVALWNFANGVDSLGRESDFAAVGSFFAGDPVSLPEPFASNADGFAGSEGPPGGCTPSFGELFVDPTHELALAAGGSMSMWARVRFGDFDGTDDVFRFGSSGAPIVSSYELELIEGSAVFAVLGSGQPSPSAVVHATTLSAGAWVDVAGVFDASAGEIRVHVHDPVTSEPVGSAMAAGVAFSSLDVSGSPLNLLFLEAPFDANGCNEGAQLEMAAVWNRALSPAEVRNLSCGPACDIFFDGFESGSVSQWSASFP